MDALVPTLYLGRPIVAGPRGRFDPELAARVIVETGVRNAFIPPTALRLMKGADVSLPAGALRTVMSGGESLGADTLAWARESLGVTVAEIYGQTEANYLVGNSPDVWDVRPGSMGLPYPGHDVAVIDADGNELPRGRDRRDRGARARPGRVPRVPERARCNGREVRRPVAEDRRPREPRRGRATCGSRAARTT